MVEPGGQGSWRPSSSLWTYSSSYDGDGQAAATLQHVHGLWGQVGSQLRPDRPEQSRPLESTGFRLPGRAGAGVRRGGQRCNTQ